jgi:hypothetical protein
MTGSNGTYRSATYSGFSLGSDFSLKQADGFSSSWDDVFDGLRDLVGAPFITTDNSSQCSHNFNTTGWCVLPQNLYVYIKYINRKLLKIAEPAIQTYILKTLVLAASVLNGL